MKLIFSLVILGTLSACSTNVVVDPRALETAVLASNAFPDGRTIEVSPRGRFLVRGGDRDQGVFEIDNPEFWSFRAPDGSILFTRVYDFARITRHGDHLTMQLIRDNGAIAGCELPIEDTRSSGRLVARHERHAVNRGDHPSIDETTKDDFFLSPEGDLIVRRLSRNVAWLPLRYVYESGFVAIIKARAKSPNPESSEATSGLAPGRGSP